MKILTAVGLEALQVALLAIVFRFVCLIGENLSIGHTASAVAAQRRAGAVEEPTAISVLAALSHSSGVDVRALAVAADARGTENVTGAKSGGAQRKEGHTNPADEARVSLKRGELLAAVSVAAFQIILLGAHFGFGAQSAVAIAQGNGLHTFSWEIGRCGGVHE